jgi:formylglycine-generating enzyme required for sulfatase activity
MVRLGWLVALFAACVALIAFAQSEDTAAPGGMAPPPEEETIADAPPDHFTDPDCGDFCRREVGLKFRDCEDCPVMVILPRGIARIGAADREPLAHADEYPSREVTFPERFAMGVYEVTFDQWEACASDGFCRTHAHPFDEGWGGGNRPVLNVSFDDITDRYGFIAWLNSKVPGTPYRLPSEAEWEYGARAGTDTWFQTGKIITDAEANFRASIPFVGSDTGVYRRETLPVGSFAPNRFRLHDMFGNAMEWTADCWHPDHEGAPLTPQARGDEGEGDCTKRVLRGGSWFSEPNELRAAFRARYDSDLRIRKAGFRVVRDLNTEVRYAEFSGSYTPKEDRPNIADADFSTAVYSHPGDWAGTSGDLPPNQLRLDFDAEIVSVSARVESVPLDAVERHYGDDCLYLAADRGDRPRLPRAVEIYCTSTSVWEGRSYFRELDLRESAGLWLPKGNAVSCPVDISVLLPDTLDPDALRNTRATCRIEYRRASPDRPVGKFLRIPYLDQYPDGPELIQPGRSWYRSWPDGSSLTIRGFSVYFFPKTMRDMVIDDVCVFALDGDGDPVAGKRFCMPDSVYVSGTNDLVHVIDFQPGTFDLEDGETLSASCRLSKGNYAADCALFVLVEIPLPFRQSIDLASLYTSDGLVDTAHLRQLYCPNDIDAYRFTPNGREAIGILGKTQVQPWQSLAGDPEANQADQDLAALCEFIFLDGLETPR